MALVAGGAEDLQYVDGGEDRRKIEPRLSRLEGPDSRSRSAVRCENRPSRSSAPASKNSNFASSAHGDGATSLTTKQEASLAALALHGQAGCRAPPGACETTKERSKSAGGNWDCGLQARERAAIAAAQGSIDPLAVSSSSAAATNQAEEYKMTALVRTDLGMGVGKIARAGLAHDLHALGAYRDACTSNSTRCAWSECGEPTIVLQVPSLAELDALLAAARARGLVAHSVLRRRPHRGGAGTKTVGCVGPAARARWTRCADISACRCSPQTL